MIGLLAASSAMPRPTSVDPVNEMTRGTGCRTNASPITRPAPTTTLRTPAGRPASSNIFGGTLRKGGGLEHDGAGGLPFQLGFDAGAAGFTDQPIHDLVPPPSHDRDGVEQNSGALTRQSSCPIDLRHRSETK